MPFPYKYFPLYAADFDTATRAMSATAVGIYIRLLISQWINGSIPASHEQLDRISGVMNLQQFEVYWAEIEHKFQKAGKGKLANRRLEVERKKVLKMSEQNRSAALARWKKNREDSELDADALQTLSESESESESESNKKEDKRAASPPLPDGLNLEAWERWVSYRREAKLKPWKPVTIKAQTKKLIMLTHEQQAKCIDQSISNGWAGLFPEKFTADNYYREGRGYHNPSDDWGRQGGVLRCGPLGRDPEIVSRGFRNPWGIAFNSSNSKIYVADSVCRVHILNSDLTYFGTFGTQGSGKG